MDGHRVSVKRATARSLSYPPGPARPPALSSRQTLPPAPIFPSHLCLFLLAPNPVAGD